jgi:hypothetical protein
MEGLLITAATTLLIANLLDLSSISVMGSAGFLLIFAAVNAANLKLRKETCSFFLLPLLGLLGCSGALCVLLWQIYRTSPAKLLTLAVMAGLAFLLEWPYRKLRRGIIRL